MADLVSTAEMARRYKISPIVIYKWVHGGCPAYQFKSHSRIRLDPDEVDAWLRRRRWLSPAAKAQQAANGAVDEFLDPKRLEPQREDCAMDLILRNKKLGQE